MSDSYGDRIRRRARLAQIGRALFFVFALGGLVFGGVRAYRALRGGAHVVQESRP